MRAHNSHPKTAAVITTCNRFDLLAERSLPSVVAQTRGLDYLVVVDSSIEKNRPGNRDLVNSLNLPNCEISYIENERSKGASAGWNTAIDFLVSAVEDPSQVFVAILDDDDSWSPTYHESCFEAARERQLDMVAADHLRFESLDGQPITNHAPEELRADDFLKGNPGIQGSNLFLRLSVLLAAGGFDEGLKSTTDRDLCIRIAELGTVRYGRHPAPLVNHFAEPRRTRLSARGSPAKIDGLTSFWRKYHGRMSAEIKLAFRARARDLFDWNPPDDASTDRARVQTPTRALIIGLVIDNASPDKSLDVVRRLSALRDERLVGLHIVLLEHGARKMKSAAHTQKSTDCEADSAAIDRAADLLQGADVACFRFTLAHQREHTALGLFNGADSPKSDGTQMAIPAASHSREMLLGYCARIALKRAGGEVWLAREPKCGARPPAGNCADGFLDWLCAEPMEVPTHETKAAPPAAIRKFDELIQSEREITAERRIRSAVNPKSLRLLGHGSESVVFTDEKTVYKCIDYWKTRMPRHQIEFLQRNTGRWDYPGLYSLHKVADEGTWTLLTYDYEPSDPYEGGHESDLIRLLESCRAAGIVCNNIHPKNLVVTKSNGVKLIDYGSEIRPWIPVGFELMARRMFLTCKHAKHPQIDTLMRRVLSEHRFEEMSAYPEFRRKLKGDWGFSFGTTPPPAKIDKAPDHPPFALCVGVISSDPAMLKPFLQGIAPLGSNACVRVVNTLVLDNGGPKAEMRAVVEGARRQGMRIAIIDEDRQRRDAASGAFGAAYRDRPSGQVEIARARTMLQRYLGALLSTDTGAVGWVLDDDMRVDARAGAYLPWLPEFRHQGVDVLIGAYEGYSPNPPLNGIRVQLVDILHNIHWLRNLDQFAVLPNRGKENKDQRKLYSDYYYDLSRRHREHLETPHWLVPANPGETVREAYCGLQAGAAGVLNGFPLTRPLIAIPPRNPIKEARDSVNRGGCTFILNHRALSQTPNSITNIKHREARRSDMVWAIVNRHYRRMTIKAVQFPVNHLGRVTNIPDFNREPDLNVEKVQSEIIGSSLYAAKTEFLSARPDHELDFSAAEAARVCDLADKFLEHRLRNMEMNWYRIAGLGEAIRRLAKPGEFQDLIEYLDRMITSRNFEKIRNGVGKHDRRDVENFLVSLRRVADDYAAATVNIDFALDQLGIGKPGRAGGKL